MQSDPRLLEEKAHQCLSQDKFKEAFDFFRSAAGVYRHQANHKQAALCFAAAAGCWSKKCGENAFYNSALAYEEAAFEAEKTADLEYASLLYKYAAINYERDGEFLNYSDCFYRSKECYRRFLAYFFISPKKLHHIVRSEAERSFASKCRYFFTWALLSLSCFVWGHGEHPARAFISAMSVFLLSAIAYYFSAGLLKGGVYFKPDFFDALYFSASTFTTVGYGDITVSGLTRGVAIFEAFCGIFVMPLFVIALSRKYLRI